MTKCNTVFFFTELTVKKDLFYIDARARYAILKELVESPDT